MSKLQDLADAYEAENTRYVVKEVNEEYGYIEFESVVTNYNSFSKVYLEHGMIPTSVHADESGEINGFYFKPFSAETKKDRRVRTEVVEQHVVDVGGRTIVTDEIVEEVVEE